MFAKLIAPVILVASFTQFAFAQTEFSATLAGHAVLPAQTFIDPPADAPEDLKISGKFTDGLTRNETIGSFEGRSAGRPTVVFLPFKGQPVQGHSSIKKMADGTYWVLTDNGFGAKANSPDAALFLSQYHIDMVSGKIERLRTVFLHDPDKKKCPSELFMKVPQKDFSQVLILTLRAFKSLVVNFGLVTSLVPI